MRLDRIFSFALVGLLLTGCVSPQASLNSTTVSQIKEGVSRRAEVEQMLGQARTTTVGANRNTAAQYFSRKVLGTGAGSDIQFRGLSVVYGPDQVVRKILFDETLIHCQPTAQGVTTGRFVSHEELASLEKSKTTRAELVARFGAPTIRILNTEGNEVFNWIYTSADGHSASPRRKQTFWAVIDEKGLAGNFGITGNVP